MIGVEVGHAEVTDAAFAAQPIELEHRVEVPGVPVLPPVKLQQVDAREAKPLETLSDAVTNDLRRHRSGERAPLGERPRVSGAGLREIAAHEDLGAAVVVRHVERVEPRVGILAECLAGGVRIERPAVALHVGDLPQAGEHPRHLEPGRELDARRAKWSIGHGAGKSTIERRTWSPMS